MFGLLLVVGGAVLVARLTGDRRAGVPGSADVPVTGASRVLRRWAGAVLSWGVIVLALSVTGALGGAPVLALPVLIAGMAVPLWLVSRSPVMRRIVRDVDLAYMTWFNTTRVPAGIAFAAVGAHGLLPVRFAANAAWGDLAAGLLAPVVIVVAGRLTARGRYRTYLAFHALSFGDLMVAVGTGLVFILRGDPLMRTLLDTPMAFIALWLGGTARRSDQPACPAPAGHPTRMSYAGGDDIARLIGFCNTRTGTSRNG